MMESKQKSMFVQFALEPLWKVRREVWKCGDPGDPSGWLQGL